MCLWKQWKRIRTKYRNLIKLGLPDWAALSLANTRKAYWHIAGDSLNNALPNAYWAKFGLMSLTNRYCEIRSTLPPYTERYVRWCEGTVDKLIIYLLLD
jgi:hypothetical protein